MSRVPVWLISTSIDQTLARGLPMERAVEGLGLTLDQLRNPRMMVEWDTLMRIGERLLELGVTYEQTTEVFADSWHHPGLGRAARWLCNVSSPNTAYELIVRSNLLAYFRAVRARYDWLDDGRLRLAIEVVEGHRTHPVMWSAVKGLLHGLPDLFQLPRADVTVTAGRTHATFHVTLHHPQPARSTLSWLRRWIVPGRVLGDVISQQESLASTFELLRSTHERLRRQADALRESEARYRGVIENSADVILVIDADGSIAMASPSARAMLDLETDEEVRDVFECVHPDDVERVRAGLICSLQEEFPKTIELRALSRRGRVHWIEVSPRRIPGTSTTAGQILIVARDITRRVREEEQQRLDAERLELEVQKRTHQLQRANQELRELHLRLIAVERVGAERELAGSVAHAINNPLAALIGNAQMLREDEPDPRLDRVLHLAARVRAVVEGTLELSRGEKPELTPEDPADVLEEVQSELEISCRSRNVRIELRPPTDAALVCADRTLLRTALVALAENAIEASPEGDVVTLETRIHKQRNVLEFCIEDRGAGIPDDIRTRVFEPFFTTKRMGTGLGLAIARAVVARHEGNISLDRSEQGTRARVEIPLYVAPGPFEPLPGRARRAPAATPSAGGATP